MPGRNTAAASTPPLPYAARAVQMARVSYRWLAQVRLLKQLDWLDASLAAADAGRTAAQPWVVLVGNHPLYSTSSDASVAQQYVSSTFHTFTTLVGNCLSGGYTQLMGLLRAQL